MQVISVPKSTNLVITQKLGSTRRPALPRKRSCLVRAEETDKPEGQPEAPKSGSFYADELPEVPRKEISDAMKEKMRREYYGLGGSPNQTMGGNYFLYIILLIAFLATLSSFLGYI